MRTRLSLQEVENSVINPVLTQIVKDIAYQLALPKDPYVKVSEDAGVLKTKGNKGSIGSAGQRSLAGANDNLSNALIVTGYRRKYVEGTELQRLNLVPDSYPIFLDKEIDLVIKPTYFKERIELDIDIINTSKSILDSVITNLKQLLVFPGLSMKHNVDYTYTIPKRVKYLLFNICYNKNKNRPEGKEQIPLLEYINQVKSNSVTYRTSENDNTLENLTLAVKERQWGVLGTIEDEVADKEIEKDDENTAYKLSITYSFELLTPSALYLDYPIMVYNMLLAKELRQTITTPDDPYVSCRLYTHEAQYQSTLLSPVGRTRYEIASHMIMPKNDEVMEEYMPQGFNRLFAILIQADKNDLNTICNLDDKEILLQEPMKEFLKNTSRDTLGTLYESLIVFKLYENRTLDRSRTIRLDINNNLVVDKPLDITKVYRLMCYVCTDLSLIKNEYFSKIKDFINQNHNEQYGKFIAWFGTYGKLRDKNVKQQDLNMEIANVRNKYLSTLDLFIQYYNLDVKEVNEIISKHQEPFTVLVKFREYDIFSMKTKEISCINLLRKDL